MPFSLFVAQPMRYKQVMKVALATSHGRMAPCFAGVELRIVAEHTALQSRDGGKTGGQADLVDADVLSTHGWHPLAWGRELMRRDVGLLLCAGIDQGTWAAIQGHGIQVIPNAIGDTQAAFGAWHSGRLSLPRVWPSYPAGLAGFGAGGFDRLAAGGFGPGRRRRFRGGRG